jgi:hypothetical protein
MKNLVTPSDRAHQVLLGTYSQANHSRNDSNPLLTSLTCVLRTSAYSTRQNTSSFMSKIHSLYWKVHMHLNSAAQQTFIKFSSDNALDFLLQHRKFLDVLPVFNLDSLIYPSTTLPGHSVCRISISLVSTLHSQLSLESSKGYIAQFQAESQR